MKILIIQQKMIGDVLTSTVLFKVLKKKYPDAILHYLINTHTYPVVEGNPLIDEFIFFTSEIEKNSIKLNGLIKKVQSEKYDTVIDAYGKLSSQLITKFSGAKTKIGYKKKLSSFYYSNSIHRTKVPSTSVSLAIENRLKLVAPLNVPFEVVTPDIFLQPSEKEQAATFLSESGISEKKPLYMISVLGSNPSKTYPFEYMASLLDAIISVKPDAQLLFNYIPNQKEDAKAIYTATKEATQQQIFFDVFGKSLREFLAITSRCDAMIGNEGGGVNMAKALGVPSFIIFSPHLNKVNWFGSSEHPPHTGVHLDEDVKHTAADRKLAKKDPKNYYLKFKPTFIIPKLNAFIQSL
ncbi:glycosyltransferase family 9 protein [Patiriisocius hiemis]|uniref:Glycosyltransferase family 9 protein n=1 Tax=Patiriisocius hiemis TaxID=3075604 RepID=A0ABU2YA41_9FLAO|nr:glycosyltransferase family 9 protein [Constantimarinum sp. W242]MDT0554655.1 glycosyltransferase family 9 protein [Constantimarinum sp. W242]